MEYNGMVSDDVIPPETTTPMPPCLHYIYDRFLGWPGQARGLHARRAEEVPNGSGASGSAAAMSSEHAVREVTARKTHLCINDFAHDRRINPGDQYWRYTYFNSSVLGYARTAGHPVQMKICAACHQDGNA